MSLVPQPVYKLMVSVPSQSQVSGLQLHSSDLNMLRNKNQMLLLPTCWANPPQDGRFPSLQSRSSSVWMVRVPNNDPFPSADGTISFTRSSESTHMFSKNNILNPFTPDPSIHPYIHQSSTYPGPRSSPNTRGPFPQPLPPAPLKEYWGIPRSAQIFRVHSHFAHLDQLFRNKPSEVRFVRAYVNKAIALRCGTKEAGRDR